MGCGGSAGRDRVVIRVRPARPDDAPAIAALYGPFVEHTWVSFETVAPTAAEIARRIEADRGRLPWLVARVGDAFAGYAYASDHRTRAAYRWSVDVSAYLHESFHRAGIASRLYDALFGLLAAQGYANAYAGIALPNEASVGFHRQAGFETVGTYHHVGYKAGAWRDVLWLERGLAPRATPPVDPVRLDHLPGDVRHTFLHELD